ncbi:MAG: Smr/MutS family protein [Oceanospirillaceae bacterium]|nr:Smr/MutS family protein [Oceanospirillaceae bacterium]
MANFEDAHFPHHLRDEKPDSSDLASDSFADTVKGIHPYRQDKVNLRTHKRLAKSKDKTYQRLQATLDNRSISDGLSTEAVDIVDSDQSLLFGAQGIQIKLLKRLQKGQIPWEQGVDLHGLSIDQARDHLSDFINSSFHQHCYVVLVVHGKAFSQTGSLPILKSYCNDWLRQLPQVLAFSSAQAKDGGTGALYVLLRRKKRQ